MFGKKVAIRHSLGVQVSRQLSQQLIGFKDETSHLHPLWLRQKKRFVAKYHIIEDSGQGHKSVEPLQNDTPSQPGLQNILNGWQQTFYLHGFCCKPWKRLIFEHLEGQVSQSALCSIGPVVDLNGRPQNGKIVFRTARHNLLHHVEQAASQEACICSKALCVHPVWLEQTQASTGGVVWPPQRVCSRMFCKEGLRGSQVCFEFA